MKRKNFFISMVFLLIAVISLSFYFLNKEKMDIPITNFHSFCENEMKEKMHLKLISETSNQREFLDKDGTKTLYMYSSDIPQINTESSSIIEPNISENYFVKNYNDTYINFPKNSDHQNAILISRFNTEMKIYGLISGNAYETKMKNINGDLLEMLVYENAKFYSSMQGFHMEKELDIGKDCSIDFKVEIDNCYTDVSCSEYILFRDTVTDNVKGIIYAPVGFYENELFFGELKIISENKNVFSLTSIIHNDKNASVKTSQAFALYLPKQPDSAVYKDTPIVNRYLSQYNRIGGDEGETYLRIEDLDDLIIENSKIKSAKLYIHSINEDKAKLCIEPAIDDWCSFTLKWETKPRSDPSMSIKGKKQKNGDVVFDITKLLKKWIDNRGTEVEYTIRKGVVLKNETPGSSAILASNDNGLYGSVLVLKIDEE